MKITKVEPLEISEVKVIIYERFADERGYFTETFRKSDFLGQPDIPIREEFVQANESHSQKNVIRGLHAQWDPYMGKLVRTIGGHMIDFVMDIRKSSPTFGKIIAHDMPSSPSDISSQWIWVPVGFVHGNLFLEETTIEYFCTGEYNPQNEAGIYPLDQDIDWSLCKPHLKKIFDSSKSTAIISEKDKQGFSLSQWTQDSRSSNFTYQK